MENEEKRGKKKEYHNNESERGGEEIKEKVEGMWKDLGSSWGRRDKENRVD